MAGLTIRGGDRALIEHFRRRQIVVLSPHRDDACLSLGGLLREIGHGTVLNLFTRSLFMARIPYAQASETIVGPIRDAEDRAFIEQCGLVRHELQLPEPPVDGRYSFDTSHIETDVERLTAPLMGKLSEIASMQHEGRAMLFCPAGIGGHVNHLAALEVVCRNDVQLRAAYELMFYEDLPYAAHLYKRVIGIAHLKRRLGANLPTRNVFVPDWRKKKALADLYPSQFRRPLSRRRLRPFALSPFEPHEAFWSISTIE